MPHTNRKKKPTHSKRVEIEDSDGWTRVTKTSTMANLKRPSVAEVDNMDIREPVELGEPVWPEHEIPYDASVEKAMARYKFLAERWLASESWSVLKLELESKDLRSDNPIASCILFGSGSVSGWFRGWVERHDVALTQIAVFKSIVDLITEWQHGRPKCYAQEPEYNHVDKAFLKELDITIVDDPQGFGLIGKNSFAYTPGAEMHVAIRSVFSEPRLYLTHELDHYTRNEKGIPTTKYKQYSSNQEGGELITLDQLEAEEDADLEFIQGRREANENECRIIECFASSHDSVKIPDFEAKDHPFHNQHLYYIPKSSLPNLSALKP